MVDWSTVGLVKSQRAKGRTRVTCNVLRKFKPSVKKSSWIKGKPGDLEDIRNRQLKNPLYDEISFLHGMDQVVYYVYYYYQTVFRDELMRTFYGVYGVAAQELRNKFFAQLRAMCVLHDVVCYAHKGEKPSERTMAFEVCPIIVGQLEKMKNDPRCPCNNGVYMSYLNRLRQFLIKDHVLISAHHFGNIKNLRRKKQFFQALEKIKETFMFALWGRQAVQSMCRIH